MTLRSNKNHLLTRFVSCVNNLSLLQISLATGRAQAGEITDLIFCDDFSRLPMKKMTLTRQEICRGKISRRNNQTKLNHLEERK